MTASADANDWIGRVPAHWSKVLLRLVARIESGHTPSRKHPEYWVPSECVIPWFSLADIWQLRDGRQKYLGQTSECISELGMAHSAARVLPAGPVVLSRTASVGFTGIMPIPMATTQDFANWVCSERIMPDFLLWVLRAMKPDFLRLMMGSTHQTIYMPDMRQLRGPLPPIATQRAIADFLDCKTAAIDALIEKKERLVALLAEQRAALIHRAVTRGLDPDVEMKDSGVEWIGEVPAHWEVKRLKFLLRGMEQGWSPECDQHLADEGGWGVLKVGCVNYSRWNELEHKALPLGVEPRTKYEVQTGDLLMSRANTSELVGSVALVGETRPRLLLCDKLYRLDVRPTASRRYLSFALNSWSTRIQHEAASSGASSSMQNISQAKAGDILLAVPPFPEQQTIARYLLDAEQGSQVMTTIANTQLNRLREYRQALITAAVTGQLDPISEAES